MFRVLFDNMERRLYLKDDLYYKVLDSSDLICELLTGKQLKSAITQLGQKCFSTVSYVGDVLFTTGDDDAIKIDSKVYNSNKLLKAKYIDNGFVVKFLKSKKVFTFRAGNMGGKYFSNDQLMFNIVEDDDEDYSLVFKSLFHLGNNVFKLTLELNVDDDFSCYFYLYLDGDTGKVFMIKYQYDNEVKCLGNSKYSFEFYGVVITHEGCEKSNKLDWLNTYMAKSSLMNNMIVE